LTTRFFFVASTVAVGSAFAAHAADLPVKAPIAPSAYSWTGSYGGIAGGYGWGHSDQTDPGIPVVPPNIVPRDGSYPVRGGLFGGTLGYNWQQRSWVLGLEGDLSWADITGHSNLCGPLTATPLPCGSKLDAHFAGELALRWARPEIGCSMQQVVSLSAASTAGTP
jgi:outer membrane immunogenic protein